ncbi:MAG: flagellar protein export ATPase FliI [Gammaproteobacteria bacterium]|nr:flagellar protein export ATPase FliI [Gammaproteobacteria bacterium]
MVDESVLADGYRWPLRIKAIRTHLAPLPTLPVEGILTRMVGLTLEAVGCHAPIGARCQVVAPGGVTIEAEVVGFSGDKLFLMPTTSLQGLVPNARVIPYQGVYKIAVGESLLGRVLDGHGQPLDLKGSIKAEAFVSLDAKAINPLSREPIRDVLDVGVRAINSLISVGRGQRLGLFAGSGVGKSVLLGMMTRHTSADVVVVGLIGERGREVKEFVQEILGDEGMKKAVVVAAPADTSPLMRIHGSLLANSIAEYFRDQGKNVLLLMDSLTRFAQAQREIALSIGEPPATKGYPPSVFAKLPQLVERAGNGGDQGGSITAFYTVLVEGDDQNDPIADSARAILDGHIVLARRLAEQAHFPAIDIEASISRCMTAITDQDHQQSAQRFRKMYSKYLQNEDLINVGAYQKGSDPSIDEAIEQHPRLMAFLAQNMSEKVTLVESLAELKQALPEAQ